MHNAIAHRLLTDARAIKIPSQTKISCLSRQFLPVYYISGMMLQGVDVFLGSSGHLSQLCSLPFYFLELPHWQSRR